jgi:hypothetical protein
VLGRCDRGDNVSGSIVRVEGLRDCRRSQSNDGKRDSDADNLHHDNAPSFALMTDAANMRRRSRCGV